MLWLGVAIVLGVGVLVMTVMAAKGPVDDLGSVSDQWIAQHRSEPR